MKRQIYHFAEINSTHDWAKENLPSFDKSAIHIVFADFQTKGRGRGDHRWHSSSGKNLLVTYGYFSPLLSAEELLLLLCFSCYELLQTKGLEPTVKMPNDLLIQGKKIAGVLGEATPEKEGLWALLGIGLNVNEDKTALSSVGQPATSLLLETGQVFDRMALLDELTSLFEGKIEKSEREKRGM